jgi:hypothetical protein
MPVPNPIFPEFIDHFLSLSLCFGVAIRPWRSLVFQPLIEAESSVGFSQYNSWFQW